MYKQQMIFFNSVLTVYWLSTFLDLKLCQKYFNKVRKVFFYSWKFLSLHIVGRIRIRVSKSFDSDPGYFDSDPLPTVHLLDPPLLISVTSTSSSNYWVTGTVGKEQGMHLRGSVYSVVHGQWRACSSYSFSWPYSMCKKLATLRDFRNLGVCLHMLSALVLVLDSPDLYDPQLFGEYGQPGWWGRVHATTAVGHGQAGGRGGPGPTLHPHHPPAGGRGGRGGEAERRPGGWADPTSRANPPDEVQISWARYVQYIHTSFSILTSTLYLLVHVIVGHKEDEKRKTLTWDPLLPSLQPHL